LAKDARKYDDIWQPIKNERHQHALCHMCGVEVETLLHAI
jgi:hypothetical protein